MEKEVFEQLFGEPEAETVDGEKEGEIMTKIDWKRKLSSRKLWAAVVGVIVGLAAAFGIEGNDYAEVAGIVTSAVSVMAYIFGESAIDAAAAPYKDEAEKEHADGDE